MKYLIIFLFIASFGSIITGYVIANEFSPKFIGFGVLCLFLVVIPLFIYHRWKDRKVKDYMLTEENLKKMRESQK